MEQNALATLDSRAESRAVSLIYAAGFSYIITLGLVSVLVPLYALALGFNLAELGALVASQAVFGLMLRLFAGAVADHFGERWVLWFSFGTMAVGAGFFAFFDVFWILVVGQLFIGFSRATYWTASQSYASRINAVRSGELLGRINASGNVGQVLGTVAGGVLAGLVGYTTAFGVTTAVAVAGLAGSLALPHLPQKEVLRSFRQALAPVPRLLGSRGMVMAGIGAAGTSTLVSVTAVLTVPYLREIGHSESVVGVLSAVTLAASAAVGVTFGALLRRVSQRELYTVAFGGIGLSLIAVPMAGELAWLLVVLLAGLGLGRGTTSVLYSVTATANSPASQRGVAMGVAGLYWGTAQLSMPAALGAIAAATSLSTAFVVAGAVYLSAGVLMPMVYPLLTKGARLAGERGAA